MLDFTFLLIYFVIDSLLSCVSVPIAFRLGVFCKSIGCLLQIDENQ